VPGPQRRWPATVAPVRAGGRCSCDSKQTSPARNTLTNKPGGMQPWSAVHCIRTAGVRWPVTEPMNAKIRPVPGSPACIARRGTPRSVCCPIVWPPDSRDRCTMSRSLDRVEQTNTVEAAADQLRLDIELPGALRWIRRRFQPIYASFTILKGLSPERFADCEPTLASFRQRLVVGAVLPALREIAAEHLVFLPPPLGLRPPPRSDGEPKRTIQHQPGPDPPPCPQ